MNAADTAFARYRDATRAVAALPEIDALAGARVCVAGFTGQVGSALVEILRVANRTTLRHRPARVTGIARTDRGPVDPSVEAVYADITDVASAEFTHVFYAVGVTSDYRSRPGDVIATQLIGLQAFLERVDPACRFVFVSSARVYGRHATDDALSEDSEATVVPMHLDNVYDSAKRLAESLCLWHAARRGVGTTVVRAANVFGLDAPRSATAVSGLVREAVTEGRIALTGNPSSIRNYCSAIDLAQGLVQAAVRGGSGRAYNVGSDEHLTTYELAEAIAGCFEAPVEIVTPADPGPASYQRLSIERARAELGYAPRLRIREILPAVAAELQRPAV